jgi:pimeloyl-ACP methyl ester carboxylesterase
VTKQRARVTAALAHAIAWGAPLSVLDDIDGRIGDVAAAGRPQHGSVSVGGGVRLHYVSAGVGPPVLLVPGWPQSWYAWRFVMPLLTANGRRVVAVDPRGLGDSDMPPDGYDLDTACRDLHRLIEHLGLRGDDGVDIVAHDIGCWITHAVAVAHPADVNRLVLIDAAIPGITPPPQDWPDDQTNRRSWHFGFNRLEGLPEALIHGREREFLSWFFGPAKMGRPWTMTPDALDEYVRILAKPGAVDAGMKYYRAMLSAEGLAASRRRAQSRLTAPVLTVSGARGAGRVLFDTVVQFSSDVRNVTFADIGHYVPEECPDELVDVINRFWAQT